MFRRDDINGTLEDVVKLFSGLFTKEEIFKLQENIIVKLLKCFISIEQSSIVQFKLHFKDLSDIIGYYKTKYNFINLNYVVAKILKKIYSKYSSRFYKHLPDMSKIFLSDDHCFINLMIVILIMFKQTKNNITKDSSIILQEFNLIMINATNNNKFCKKKENLCGILNFILESCNLVAKFTNKTYFSELGNKNTPFNSKIDGTPINHNKIKIQIKYSNSICSRLVSPLCNPANAPNVNLQNRNISKCQKSRNSKIKSLKEEIQSEKFLTSRNPNKTPYSTTMKTNIGNFINKNEVSNFQKYILNVIFLLFRANL
jgi:hypothetical protein